MFLILYYRTIVYDAESPATSAIRLNVEDLHIYSLPPLELPVSVSASGTSILQVGRSLLFLRSPARLLFF